MFPTVPLPPANAEGRTGETSLARGHVLNMDLFYVFESLDIIESLDRDLARKFYEALAVECKRRAER